MQSSQAIILYRNFYMYFREKNENVLVLAQFQ